MKTDLKSTWLAINGLLGKYKSSECTALKHNGSEYIEPKEIASIFNNYFSSAAIKLTESLPPSKYHYTDYLGPKNPNSIFYLSHQSFGNKRNNKKS